MINKKEQNLIEVLNTSVLIEGNTWKKGKKCITPYFHIKFVEAVKIDRVSDFNWARVKRVRWIKKCKTFNPLDPGSIPSWYMMSSPLVKKMKPIYAYSYNDEPFYAHKRQPKQNNNPIVTEISHYTFNDIDTKDPFVFNEHLTSPKDIDSTKKFFSENDLWKILIELPINCYKPLVKALGYLVPESYKYTNKLKKEKKKIEGIYKRCKNLLKKDLEHLFQFQQMYVDTLLLNEKIRNGERKGRIFSKKDFRNFYKTYYYAKFTKDNPFEAFLEIHYWFLINWLEEKGYIKICAHSRCSAIFTPRYYMEIFTRDIKTGKEIFVVKSRLKKNRPYQLTEKSWKEIKYCSNRCKNTHSKGKRSPDRTKPTPSQ